MGFRKGLKRFGGDIGAGVGSAFDFLTGSSGGSSIGASIGGAASGGSAVADESKTKTGGDPTAPLLSAGIGALGLGLDALGTEQLQRQQRRAARRVSASLGEPISGIQDLLKSRELGALRLGLLRDLEQPVGIDAGSQRQMLSTLRGQTSGQASALQRQLSEQLAARGLGGGSIETAGRAGIARQQLASLAGAQQQLSLESEQQRRLREQQARGVTLGLVGGITGAQVNLGNLLAQQAAGATPPGGGRSNFFNRVFGGLF